MTLAIMSWAALWVVFAIGGVVIGDDPFAAAAAIIWWTVGMVFLTPAWFLTR
jgi:hypothetical protein